MKFKSLRKNKKAFTLVELIVVLAILAIMIAVTVPSFIGYVDRTKAQMEALEQRNEDLQSELDAILDDAGVATPAP